MNPDDGPRAVAQEFLAKFNDAILFPLITLMLAIALLVFLYGAFEYVQGADNDGAREKGRTHLLFGIIGMLVMVSAMAILTLAAGTFGLKSELQKASDPGRNFQGDSYYFIE